MFGNVYAGKRVLVTGHTGFKGAWLCQWLTQLGAEVAGLALEPLEEPNLYSLLGLESKLSHHLVDIRDQAGVDKIVQSFQPEVVLHLAAQPLVRLSYAEPVHTWSTNVMGTVHVLEAVRNCPSTRACVVVSSDKCYMKIANKFGAIANTMPWVDMTPIAPARAQPNSSQPVISAHFHRKPALCPGKCTGR